MKCFLTIALSLVFLLAPAQERKSDILWEQSVVTLDITHKQYDYQQPWAKRTRSALKTGVVISPKEILTTAEELADRTLIRIQKNGRGKWWTGEVAWIDYHANLAVVTAADDSFWQGLKPAALAAKHPARENLQILRWKNGNLETRKAEFNQYLVDDGRLTFVNHLQMEAGTEMSGVGWAEPLVSGPVIIGLTSGQTGNNARLIPAPFIRGILDARARGGYRGLGYFPFFWQPVENPATHKFLRLEGEPRGVVVIDVPKLPGRDGVLKPRDLILQVDGFDIDVQGYYLDPDYGQLILENLATRGKFAGDTVRLKLWRAGRPLDVDYQLPKAEYSAKLLPDQLFDQAPEYLIAGGLLFQPLTIPFLRSFGGDWRRSAPFRLNYYNNDSPTPERPGLVVLSSVLPDIYNLGYQDARNLVVDQVNGQKVSRLADLQAALRKPVAGFHIIEFARSDSLRRVVLDAGQLEAATGRVLNRFQIQKESLLPGAEK